MTTPDPSDPTPALLIEAGDISYTVQASDGAVTIGRELPAQIRIDDPRVSRTHLRVEPGAGHWVLTDVGSTNGTFRGGRKITSTAITTLATVHLGNADGIVVHLRPLSGGDAAGAPATGGAPAAEPTDDDETTYSGAHGDPGLTRAGAAVAARREELQLSQRKLSDDKIISQSVLVAFERGRSWPRERTRTKIEEYLGWPPGAIDAIRRGAPVPQPENTNFDDDTELLSDTVRVNVMVDAVEIAMRGITARVKALPATTSPQFGAEAAQLLAEVRKLESSVAHTARTAKGSPELALLLSDVRRTLADLTLRAAKAPQASLGQRLYAARHQADLTLEEVANAARVDAKAVADAEAERALPDDARAALESLTARLSRHR